MVTATSCIKVLLVEADPGCVHTMQEFLSQASEATFETTCATTLKDALEMLRISTPEAVVLDLQLSDGDGIQVLRQVYQESGGAPIVVLTGEQNKFLTLDLVREGAQEYLTKAQLRHDVFIRALQHAIERKKIESALKDSEAQHRITIDSMLDALHVVDGSLRIVLMNKSFKKWNQSLALTENPEGMFLFDVFPFLSEKVRQEYQQVLAAGKMLVTEEQTLLPGGIISTETRKIPIFKDNKVAQVITVIRDITARKHIEKELQGQERFLSSVFMSIQDGVSVLDKDMNILRVNPAMEKWFSHAMPLVGKKCFQAYHNRSGPCKICPTMKTLATGEASYELNPRHGPNGKIIGWFDLYAFPLLDAETGEMTGVIEYVRDISARKQAEVAKEKLTVELVKSNRRLKQLSLHDFQTGLYNHRFLEGAIEAEFNRAKRYYHPLSVILLDIDYFKSINDVYGHEFGDVILKQLARELKKLVRGYDSVVRLGGEEFLIISPGADRPSALTFAQRLLDALNVRTFGDTSHAVKLKLSLGVATYPDDRLIKGMDMVNLAEHIIVKAKESGGNRVYSSVDIATQRGAHARQHQEHAGVKTLKNKLHKLTKKTNQGLIESIFALSKTIELKDHYTGAHVENTVRYATDLAARLNLPKNEIDLVRQAAMLHDVGKIGIPERILLKKAKLTKKEFEEIKKHPQIGADILRPIQLLHDIIPLILYHHERWDGKGYTHGLKKEEIPLGARIIAIADVYQALTSDRPYRKALSQKKAVQIIRDGAGAQFDPQIVCVFLGIIQKK